MSWYIYILECKDGSFYTGMTDDPERRLAAHRAGKGAKYTRGRAPLTLVYSELCGDRSAALRREAAVKRLTHEQKHMLIAQHCERQDISAPDRQDTGKGEWL